MRKSILAMFVMMIALFAVACGGNKPANGGNTADGAKCGGTDAPADVWAAYKHEGLKAVVKNTMKMEGMPDNVSYMVTEITKVDKDFAMMKTTMLDKDKKEMAPGTETKIEFKTAEPVKDAKPVEAKKPEEKKVKVEAGEFDCVSYDGENWMMKDYPFVIVKSKMGELVEFNKGK
jgi:hypothetical protein